MPLGGNQYKSNPVISVQFDHVNKNRQNVLNQRTEDASRPERLTQRSTPSSPLDKPVRNAFKLITFVLKFFADIIENLTKYKTRVI